MSSSWRSQELLEKIVSEYNQEIAHSQTADKVVLKVKLDGAYEKKITRDTVHKLLNPFCIKVVGL